MAKFGIGYTYDEDDEYDYDYEYDRYDDDDDDYDRKPPRKAFWKANNRVRDLVLDNEKPVFKDAANRFFYDLFGVKEFATDSFAIAYSRRAMNHMSRSIEKIGSNRFVEMMLDERTYEMMRNLIVICASLQTNSLKDKAASDATETYYHYVNAIKKRYKIRRPSSLSTITDPIKNLKKLGKYEYEDFYGYDDDNYWDDDYRPKKYRYYDDDDGYDEDSIADVILGNEPRARRRKPGKKQHKHHECRCRERECDDDDEDGFVNETKEAVEKMIGAIETLDKRVQSLETGADDEIHVSAPSPAMFAKAYANPEPEPERDIYGDDIRERLDDIQESLKDLAIDYGKTKKVTQDLIKSMYEEEDESPGDNPKGGGTLTEMTGGVITDPKQLT